ncbi:MAG: rubrerythrin family protein [Clostridia bacterium]|nr:rubrerythrin family protein [Clostridia bacterium]
MNLKGTATEKNLKKALEGEALAHLKYQFYRSKIGNLSKDYENRLDEIVHNEKEHGKIWFKLLHGGEVPENTENLLDAIKGETEEHEKMYPEFGRIAREEGFEEIAELFEQVAEIEGKHSKEFAEMLKNIENENIFEDKEGIEFKCLNCGHIHYGTEAPEECPVCKHPQKYFVRD